MLLVGYNTQFSKGKDGRIDIDRVASAIKDADIVALQEVERHWRRTGWRRRMPWCCTIAASPIRR